MAAPVPPDAASGPRRRLDVAVAGLWRPGAAGPELLVTRRPPGSHLAGAWELPGGKMELGEPAEAAARREAAEEVGLRPGRLEPLVVVEHAYPDRVVRLHAVIGRVDPGAPVRAGVEHRWVRAGELPDVDWPEANERITEALVAYLEGIG